jgi:hypothetical protein
MKKEVGSEVGSGSGSISQRCGSGDPDPGIWIRIRTKMSRIPNTKKNSWQECGINKESADWQILHLGPCEKCSAG